MAFLGQQNVGGAQKPFVGGYVNVGGVQKKIIGGYQNVGGVLVPLVAGGGEVEIGTLAVGSSVWANVNGVSTEFLIVHQGLPGSSYDSSCDGTWLLSKDIYTQMQFNSTSNNVYSASQIHQYLNNTYINLFDASVKNIFKQVKIPYYNNNTITTGASGLSAKSFLLSAMEVGTRTSGAEGSILEYFNGASDSKRIANYNGTAAVWYLRSHITSSSANVRTVTASGGGSNSTAGASRGVRPAFILPSTTLVDGDGNIIV